MKRIVLHTLSEYSDDRGNSISYEASIEVKSLSFCGSNNMLVVHRDAKVKSLEVTFDCDNGYLEIGPC